MKVNFRSIIIGSVTVASLTLGACSFGGNETPPVVVGGDNIEMSDSGTSTSAVTNGADIDVHDGPDGNVVRTFEAQTEYGTPTSFLVVENAGEWLNVLLPDRPNGSTGWIRTADVTTSEVNHRIVVDRESNMIRVEENGNVVIEKPIADGAESTPTPTGQYFVTDVLETGNPSGAYGPYAIGISAHSEVLTEFNGSDGQVGIHGTNNPDGIGQDISNGCVRLDNETIAELASVVSLGTPVQIV